MQRFMLGLRRSVAFGALFVCALAAGVTLSVSAPAWAQVVFEDNFDGSALGAHWITPPASNWVHDVSGGMLNVHRVVLPIPHPKTTQEIRAGITTVLPTAYSGDFLASMRIVWELDTVPLVAMYLGSPTQNVIFMEYYGTSVVIRPPLGPGIALPAPGAGAHDLGIQRLGSQVRFFLNGDLLGAFPAQTGPVTTLQIGFRNAYPIPQGGPVHVDSVRIIPAPGALVLLLLGGARLSRKARR